MSPFLSELCEKLVDPYANDGTGLRQLTEDFQVYIKRLKRTETIPRGFAYDRASVPRVPGIYAAFGCRYDRPALVHDYLCRMGRIKREKADLVFLDLMRAQNEDELAWMAAQGIDDDEIADRKAAIEGRALAMYAAVALFTRTGLWKTEVDQPGFEPVA
jgi:hypothetical protein